MTSKFDMLSDDTLSMKMNGHKMRAIKVICVCFWKSLENDQKVIKDMTQIY